MTFSVLETLPGSYSKSTMNIEKTIAEIERLERIYSLPDTRPLQLADLKAANQKHDEMYSENPWFRLWKRYAI